ncbi:hypothetical protein HZB93_03550 [Candidatus Falkowbacteria bacterium]|nr:hypothetical protein [Candidatus Falkowbacteria bacterium]
MKVTLTDEEIRRPLGSGLPERAKRFLERVGSVNTGDYNDEGFGIPEGDPIDWTELERTRTEADRQFLTAVKIGPMPKR